MINKTKAIVGIVLFLNIVIIWLPNQFETTAIQELWRIRARFDGNIDTFNDIGITTDEIYASRPVGRIVNNLAYILTPDSFTSYHIILIMLLFAKGFVFFLLLQNLLPEYPMWVYMCATLLIAYPSDPAVVSMRVTHYHLGIVLILLSIYFLIQYYRHRKKYHVVLMWITQLIAGFNLEIGYPIFFFTPLILVILERRISKHVIIATILFYIVPFATFVYSIYTTLILGLSFQSTAIESYTIKEHLRHIYNLYEHNFLTAWQNIMEYITTQATLDDLLVFTGTTLVTGVGGIILKRQIRQSEQPSVFIRIIIVLISGGVAVLLGYVTYLPSRTHVNTDYRVYLLASVGAAAFFGTLAYIIYHRLSGYAISYLVILGFSMAVGLTGVFANKTHHEYLGISRVQESLARQITTAIPAFRDDAYVVIKMPSNGKLYRLEIGELQKPVLFSSMLKYIYHDYEHVKGSVLCFTDYLSCQFDENDMTIQASNFTNLPDTIPNDQLIIFNISRDGDLTLIKRDESLANYNPSRLIDTEATPPNRIATIFGSAG